MRISILCSDEKHPVYKYLQKWCTEKSAYHQVELFSAAKKLTSGDMLFLVSCSEFISVDVRDRFGSCLVLHASDLPKGRGWSPLVWQVLEGKNDIVVSLLEAADSIDTGKIWFQCVMNLEGHELADEINIKLFELELRLMDYAVENNGKITPVEQKKGEATYYPKRAPDDSRLEPNATIAEQFELLRICDNERYPAFFKFRGHEYEIKISKRNKVSDE